MSESFNQQNLDPSALTFDEHGLIPAIVQDENDGAVLMMAYMDKESLRRTLKEGRAWFFSRSRQSYWLKGESSGNIVRVSRVSYDCDGDTLLLQASIQGDGVACHTGARSCFYRSLSIEGD